VRQFGGEDLNFLVEINERSQLCMFKLKGLIRASVWYAHLCCWWKPGLEGSCRESQRFIFRPKLL